MLDWHETATHLDGDVRLKIKVKIGYLAVILLITVTLTAVGVLVSTSDIHKRDCSVFKYSLGLCD